MDAPRAVLIVRPQHAGDPLIAELATLGCEVFEYPVMRISPFAVDTPEVLTRMQCLGDYHKAVFVSRRAAQLALSWWDWYGRPWPLHVECFAVGESSAQPLRAQHIEVTVPARGASSEALLALPQLQPVSGQRVLIMRGEGGRALLADTLVARGAEVDYCDLYRRVVDARHAQQLQHILTSKSELLVVIHSVELMHAVTRVLGSDSQDPLARHCLLVPGERVAEQVRRVSAATIIVARSAVTGHMVGEIRRWYTGHQ